MRSFRGMYVLAAALLTHFNWFALIVFHGVLVPNTLARGVGVMAGMVVLALVIDGTAAGLSPPTGRWAGGCDNTAGGVNATFGQGISVTPMLALPYG